MQISSQPLTRRPQGYRTVLPCALKSLPEQTQATSAMNAIITPLVKLSAGNRVLRRDPRGCLLLAIPRGLAFRILLYPALWQTYWRIFVLNVSMDHGVWWISGFQRAVLFPPCSMPVRGMAYKLLPDRRYPRMWPFAFRKFVLDRNRHVDSMALACAEKPPTNLRRLEWASPTNRFGVSRTCGSGGSIMRITKWS